MIAALYVETNGVYANIPGVDPYDELRDARKYQGPHPVVAHPPCKRWGRYWSGGPSAKETRTKGDDGGCFAAALFAVRTWGGVLEHPEASHAWRWFGLRPPLKGGGFTIEDEYGGRSCCVEQGHYGHRARKATWLYVVAPIVPELIWGKSAATIRLDTGFHSAKERAAAKSLGSCAGPTLTPTERLATPREFAETLIGIAKSVTPCPECQPTGEAKRPFDPNLDSVAWTAERLEPLSDAFLGQSLIIHRREKTVVNVRGFAPGTGGDAILAEDPETGTVAAYRRSELSRVFCSTGEGGA